MKKRIPLRNSGFHFMALLTAFFAASAASLCCVGPFILMVLGIGGGWMANLTVFEPYRPAFTVVTIVLLILSFRKLYLKSGRCNTGEECENATHLKKQRVMFWLMVLLLVALITFPYYGQVFY